MPIESFLLNQSIREFGYLLARQLELSMSIKIVFGSQFRFLLCFLFRNPVTIIINNFIPLNMQRPFMTCKALCHLPLIVTVWTFSTGIESVPGMPAFATPSVILFWLKRALRTANNYFHCIEY